LWRVTEGPVGVARRFDGGLRRQRRLRFGCRRGS